MTKKSTDSVIAEMTTLEEKTHSTIMLCLADDIIIEVAEEETASSLWLKLEFVYDKISNQQVVFEATFVQPANERRYAS